MINIVSDGAVPQFNQSINTQYVNEMMNKSEKYELFWAVKYANLL